MKIVFFGTPKFAVPTLLKLVEHHEVIAVVTQPDKKKNRGQKLLFSDVKEEALKLGIEVLQPERLREASIPEADAYVVVAYGQIFPERLLCAPRYGCLNVHASLLPNYRGAAPIQRAIEDGAKESGVCIMRMEKGLDTGDVILKQSVEIGDKDSVQLSEELSHLGARMMVDALDLIASGKAQYEKQGPDFTYAGMIGKKDYEMDFSKSYRQNLQKIRAFGYIKTSIDEKSTKVYAISPVDEKTAECPEQDRDRVIVRKEGIFVRLADGWVEITELQPENSKRMPAKAYLLGRRK
ncbi:MAG: methionyl-tRNA formyltransferase [Bacillota bacterium]|nr:methionyl-tRNA formyltransferase [Bacillota bacterium]